MFRGGPFSLEIVTVGTLVAVDTSSTFFIYSKFSENIATPVCSVHQAPRLKR